MECWGHITTMREIINGEDSPIVKCNTKVEEIGDKRNLNPEHIHP